MPVSSENVLIKVSVIDANSGEVLSEVTKNFDKMGKAGTRAGKDIEDGMKKGGAGMLSATEKTRLAAEEMGVRFPRAMVTLIAQSKAAQAVLSSLSTAMIGFATIQIGAMVGEALYKGVEKIYTKWIDIDGAISRFNNKADEAASKKFYEMSGIDQLNSDLKDANRQIDELNRKRITLSEPLTPGWQTGLAAEGGPNSGWGSAGFTMQDAGDLNKARDDKDRAEMGLGEKKHKRILQAIDDTKRLNEARSGGKKDAQDEFAAANAKADEDLKYYRARQELLAGISARAGKNFGEAGYVPRPDAGAYQTETKDAKDRAAIELQINNLKKAGGKAGKDSSIEENRLQRQRLEGEREITRLRQQTQLQGLGPAARIAQEGTNREANLSPDLDPIARTQQATEIRKQTTFSVNEQLNDDAAKAAEQRTRADEEKARSDNEIAAKHTRSIEETERIEAQARVHSLRDEKQRTAAINAELEEKLAHYKEELAGQADADAQYHRRATAAEQEANAQRVEASTEARKKMAGEFTSMFEGMDHPLKYLQKLGDKFAGEAAANLVQRFDGTGVKGGAGDADSNKGMRGFMKGVSGGADFSKKHKATGTGMDALAEVPGGHAAHGADSGMIHLATATIQIGSATINGAGFGPGASTAAGSSFSTPAGGTSLLGPGGQVTSGGAPTGAVASGPSGMTNLGAPLPGTTTGSSAAGRGGAGDSSGVTAPKGAPGAALDKPSKMHEFGSFVDQTAGEAFPLYKEMKGSIKEIRARRKQRSASKGTGAGDQLNDANAGFAKDSTSPGYGSGADLEEFGGAAEAGAPMPGVRGMTNTGMPLPAYNPGATAGGFLSSASSLDKTYSQAKAEKSGTGTSSQGSLTQGGQSADQYGSEALGAAQGAVGVWAAHEGGGGVGGGLKGAASGAEMGLMIGGPIGAAVGAAAGAIIGGIGSGKNAREYDLKTVRPRIANDLEAYHSGGMNYLGAYSDAQSLQMEADQTTKKMGPANSRYFGSTIIPEIKQLMGKLDSEQRAGRSMYSASPGSYAIGTDSILETGWNLNHQGERIIPSDQNERITQAIEGGGKMPVQSTSMGDMHVHLHANDAKSGAQFLMDNMHVIRAAFNQSFAENSGGGL